MAKAAAIQHACSECGYTTGKWLGKCPTCGSWGTLVEERVAAVPKGAAAAAGRPLLRLVEVEASDAERIPTGVTELDRVLGGGLVPASVVLVSGDPGIGKSTLLLMALRALSTEHRVLLVTGEESVAQVKLRADRLGGGADVHILAETNLDEVCATLERERPEVCVIDSVQTLYAPELGSAPGSVAQVREAAGRLLRVAKEQGIATFLVGHVTKEGVVAGPRVLEHLVDCVLQFEGDRYRSHRILRAVKNRFGSTNELGVFEMTGAGLEGVEDPSAIFGRSQDDQPGSAVVCALEGTRPLLLEIQALVSPSDLAMPRRVATGVDPKRLSMIGAVLGRHAGVALGQADVFVNVAGGVRIDEPAADLGDRARDRLRCARSEGQGRPRLLRRDRADRPPTTREPGRAAPGRVREARLFCGDRAGRHRAPWQNAPDGSGDAETGHPSGARCGRILGLTRTSSRH